MWHNITHTWLTVFNEKTNRFETFEDLSAVTTLMMSKNGYSLLGRRKYNTIHHEPAIKSAPKQESSRTSQQA